MLDCEPVAEAQEVDLLVGDVAAGRQDPHEIAHVAPVVGAMGQRLDL